jgi:hypothetical protein
MVGSDGSGTGRQSQKSGPRTIFRRRYAGTTGRRRAQQAQQVQQANGAPVYASVGNTVIPSARGCRCRTKVAASKTTSGREQDCRAACKAERESTESTRLPGCQAEAATTLGIVFFELCPLLVTGVHVAIGV